MRNLNHRTLTRRTLLGGLAAAALTARASLPPPKGDLLIGQSAPLSGPMANPMANVLAGQQLAIDEINRKGGIGGRRVRLDMLDDGFDPRRTLENSRTLVEQRGALSLFGTVGTGQTMAVLPYIAEKRVPLIAAYSGSPALRVQPNAYFFTTQAGYDDELVRIVRNLVAVQAKRIAVVYQDNEFGKLLLPLAEKIIAAEGATLAGARSLQSTGADSVAAAQAVAGMKAQAVVMLVAGPAVIGYIKANRAYAGLPVYTLSLSVGSAILKALGDDARGLAVSRATPYPWRATTVLAKEFNAVMVRAGKEVDYDHYLGYINMQVMAAGLRGAGKNPTPETVKEAMEKLARLDLGGYTMEFGPDKRHGSNFVEITVVGPRGNFIR
jgi:ABC-type branched-subunit amino acid transport system substrate-binding protein